MTNKRFTLNDVGNQKDVIFDGTMELPQSTACYLLNEIYGENEQLKKDNDNLIHLLENQSMIIQELHSKLMHYELQEPIVLTKEELEVMGKAISYYSHGGND